MPGDGEGEEEGTAAEKGRRLGERENKRREKGRKTKDGSEGENTRRGWWWWDEWGEDGDKTGGDVGTRRRVHAEGQIRMHDKGSWGWTLVSLPRFPRGLCCWRETAGGLFPSFLPFLYPSTTPRRAAPVLVAMATQASRAIQERDAVREDKKVGKRKVWWDSLFRHSNPGGSGCPPTSSYYSKDVTESTSAANATVICKPFHFHPESLVLAWWFFTISWKYTDPYFFPCCERSLGLLHRLTWIWVVNTASSTVCVVYPLKKIKDTLT